MDVRIKTTEYELTAAVRKYLNTRVASIEKLLGADAAIARCEVVLGRAAGRPRHGDHLYFAEFIVRAPRKKLVQAKNNEPTINAAIDNAKEEAVRQLKKQKTSAVTKSRKAGALVKRSLRSA